MQAGIESYGYSPEPIRLAVGTAVTWTNTDVVPHSATADSDAFNSGLLLQGQTFTFTFSQPGEFAYYCTRHGGMRGLVVVTP